LYPISISGQLKKITELAERIANGDSERGIDIDGKDEIGKVAASIRKISQVVRSTLFRMRVVDNIMLQFFTYDVRV